MPDFSFLDHSGSEPIAIDTNAATKKVRGNRRRTKASGAKQSETLASVGAVLVVFVFSAIAVLRYGGAPYVEKSVSRAAMGDRWPLTVPSGEVRAYRHDMRITFVHGGQEYGLNGIARGGAWGYPKIEAITAPGRSAADLLPIGLALQQSISGNR